MPKSKTGYSSGSSSAKRTGSRPAPQAKKRRRRSRSYAAPYLALLVLVAVLAGAVFGLHRYLDGPPVQSEQTPPAGTGSLDSKVEEGESTEIISDVNDETLLPEPPQYTEDGILMTNLENGAKMYERDGLTWLVIDGKEMLLCNKEYSLPADYGDGLTAECQAAFDQMAAAAEKDGLTIWIGSGFRSYDTQKAIHDNYISIYGEEYTKSMSAEPGHSEHQTGLAMDIAGAGGYYLEQEFENTAEFAWLSEHAAEYGFILRYQKDKSWATGYIYEPWHYRYVGVELAQLLWASGVTVEEYVGLAKPQE